MPHKPLSQILDLSSGASSAQIGVSSQSGTSVGTPLAGMNDLQLGNSLTKTHKTANLAQDLLELLCQLICNQTRSCSTTGLKWKV